jgi:uncharacterized sulfatase
MHRRSRGSSPYELGHDPARYDIDRMIQAAHLAAAFNANTIPELVRRLGDADSGVRYWAATGLLIRGRDAVQTSGPALIGALDDPSPSVRVAAAEALGRYGSEEQCARALSVLLDLADLKRNGVYSAIASLNAIDAIGGRALPIKARLSALPESDRSVIDKMKENIPNLKEAILGSLGTR